MITDTYSCCAKPCIQNFDYKDGAEVIENRMCLSCGFRWHKARQFDKNRWQEMMDSDTEHTREFFMLTSHMSPLRQDGGKNEIMVL